MFNDLIECQEAIAAALMKSVHEAWEEIRVEAILDGNSVDLLVQYRPSGKSKFSGNIADVPMLGRYMFELSELVSTKEKGLFKKCFFTVHSDGRYSADFVY